MKEFFNLKPVAYIHNDFKEKFGVPRQSGLIGEAESVIVFEKEFQNPDFLRGIENFSHLWLIWQFSENNSLKVSPTVRPPRLGGNKRMGVFATRSPFRPNALGLSSVKLLEVFKTESSGLALRVAGADLVDNTPIFDIKPYLSYSDSHPDAVCGFTDSLHQKKLEVKFLCDAENILPKDKLCVLTKMLENDPRPSYHDDERTYTFSFAGFEVSFFVKNDISYVTDIKN